MNILTPENHRSLLIVSVITFLLIALNHQTFVNVDLSLGTRKELLSKEYTEIRNDQRGLRLEDVLAHALNVDEMSKVMENGRLGNLNAAVNGITESGVYTVPVSITCYGGSLTRISDMDVMYQQYDALNSIIYADQNLMPQDKSNILNCVGGNRGQKAMLVANIDEKVLTATKAQYEDLVGKGLYDSSFNMRPQDRDFILRFDDLEIIPSPE